MQHHLPSYKARGHPPLATTPGTLDHTNLGQALLPHAVACGAGLLATFPMTGAMLWHFRHLPPENRYPLPPREIVEQVALKARMRQQITGRQLDILTILAHFGAGMFGGLLYSLTAARLNKNPALQGIGFGLCFWALNYLGLLPALRLLTPATEHPPQRNALMILAHVVWGGCLGMFASISRPVFRLES